MEPSSRTARVAAVLYLLSGIPAVFSLQYVPRALIVTGNAAATADRVLASEMLFRASIVCELINVVVFIFVVRALYRLLAGVDRTQASLMVTLFAISVPISFLNVLNEVAALALFRGADFLSAIDKAQRDALAMMFLRLHGHGVNLAAIFWGLWLFPFGILVMRSGFLPRILGALLIVNGFTYPVVSLTQLLLPAYLASVSRLALIPELGELWIVLWFLIKGVGAQPAAPSRATA